MYEFLQRIFPFVVAILYIIPTAVLFLRFRQKQTVYLRRFPPIDRYQTLDMYTPGVGNPPRTSRRIREALWRRQKEPDLERLRSEMWRSSGLVALWALGVPLVAFIFIILLDLAGYPPFV
jgi:hypothetical protein